MLNILAATVVTTVLAGNEVPPSCKPRLDYLRTSLKATERAFFGDKLRTEVSAAGLIVFVVPHFSLPPDERTTMAWTYPNNDVNSIWLRVDILCVASPVAIEMLVNHEVLHLVYPEWSHTDVDNVLSSPTVFPQKYAAYKYERDTWMERRSAAWRRDYAEWLLEARAFLGPEMPE